MNVWKSGRKTCRFNFVAAEVTGSNQIYDMRFTIYELIRNLDTARKS